MSDIIAYTTNKIGRNINMHSFTDAELRAKKVSELRVLVRKHNTEAIIKGASKMNKASLVAALGKLRAPAAVKPTDPAPAPAPAPKPKKRVAPTLISAAPSNKPAYGSGSKMGSNQGKRLREAVDNIETKARSGAYSGDKTAFTTRPKLSRVDLIQMSNTAIRKYAKDRGITGIPRSLKGLELVKAVYLAERRRK